MNAPLTRPPAVDASQAIFDHEIQPPRHDPQGRTGRTYRRRRRGQREADKALHNHQTDRWMVSYADFITLLFAFFVVMYAMSSVNEGRYRVLSGVLSTAFSAGDGTKPPPAPDASSKLPGQADVKPAVATAPQPAVPVAAATPPPEPAVDPVDKLELARTVERVQHMQQLAARVDEHLQSLVRDGQVTVTRGARGIAIEINAAVLFDPARADLKPASFEALRSLAQVLSGFVEPLQIEGHSDDAPIATREFRSNWELSAARAASVGRFLIDQGVAPGRIGIAGYAEFRPLVANVGADSRARNRRVTLVVLSADDSRPKDGDAQAVPSAAGATSDRIVR